MKTVTPLKVVHESEVQRQHARLPIPARVEIGEHEYPVNNLSVGGISIANAANDYAPGKTLRMRLIVPLRGFSLTAELAGEARYFDSGRKNLGCAFTNQSQEDIIFLNHILRSYAAGDIVTPHDLLHITQRNNFMERKKDKPKENPGLTRQIAGLSLVAAIGFMIIFFIAGNLYNSFFLVKSLDAAVTGPSFDVKAPAEGFFHARLDAGAATVRKGEIIGDITTANSNQPVTVTSPCNCYVARRPAENGQYVTSAAPLLKLMPTDAKLLVNAKIDSGYAAKIGNDATALIRVFGSRVQYSGHITDVESGMESNDQNAGDHIINLKIAPDENLPVDLAGRPAVVSFRLSPGIFTSEKSANGHE